MKELVFVFYTQIPEHFSWFEKLQVKAIQWWTKSDIFHVEAVIDDKYISAETHGVVLRDLHAFSDKYKYIALDVKGSLNHHEKIKKWVFSLAGADYDWNAIWWRHFINIGKQKKNEWICSEIVNKILQLYIVEPFVRIESTVISPGEIYDELLKIGKVKTAKQLNAERGL